MTRLLPLLGLGLTAFVMPHMAAAQSVTLDPGLYDISTKITMGGNEISADESEYCILEGENSKTFDELAAAIPGEGQCTMSNVSMTESTGTANFACTDTDMGFDVSGTMDAKFGSNFYDIDTVAEIPIMGRVFVKTKVLRRGECPADSSLSDTKLQD